MNKHPDDDDDGGGGDDDDDVGKHSCIGTGIFQSEKNTMIFSGGCKPERGVGINNPKEMFGNMNDIA